MINTTRYSHGNDFLEEIADEAADRLFFAIQILRKIQESKEDFGGYQYGILEDVLKDIATCLRGAANAKAPAAQPQAVSR